MKLLLERIDQSEKQTVGRIFVLDEEGFTLEDFPCLELPWRENGRQISCIPTGEYLVKKRWSPKYKNHFHVTNVVDRSYILIHIGNYHKDTLGCILPGMDMADLNKDGEIDVTSSGVAMKKLLQWLPQDFKMKIVNGPAIK